MRNLDSCRCWRCTLCQCKVRNKFLVNFWNCTILLCILCILKIQCYGIREKERRKPFGFSSCNDWQRSMAGYIMYYSYEDSSIFLWFDSPSGPRSPHSRGSSIKLRQTAHGRIPLGEGSAHRRYLDWTTHNTHKKKTSTPRREFIPQYQQFSDRRPTP